MKFAAYIFLSLFGTFIYSQKTFSELSEGACNCISTIDETKPTPKKQQRASKCIQSAYRDYQDVLESESEAYLSENPNATDLQFGSYIQRKITSTLIDSCDPFFDIIMEISSTKPQFNNIPVTDYMKSISADMCECISNYDDLSQENADDCTVDYFDTNSAQFKKALSADSQFVENTIFYLIKTCRPYAKFSVKQGRF